MSTVPVTSDDQATAIRSIHLMASGDLADLEAVYTADAVNREAVNEPPDTRGGGPAAVLATARWLRTAFSELAWEIHDSVQDGDLVVVHATMSGRQTGPFVAYGPDAGITAVFPPLGRRFAVTQTHWFRMRDGRVAEHWANRDDLGMGQQLGWTPPTPAYMPACCWPNAGCSALRPHPECPGRPLTRPERPHVPQRAAGVTV